MIGRYRVERRLGSGAFATVWLAEDDVLESWVAIKVLADNWAHHPDVRARFEQEAQVLRRADSERLVRIHDFGELPDGRPYQVMTYAAGGTLAERLSDGPLPIRTALRVAADIARATTDLHSSGVLHRDLKPSNVLFGSVRGAESVLVADLGLAKEIAHASGFTVVAGTPGYMAPEQHLPGGGIDVRADVHAIGAMAYQMLTGVPAAPGIKAPSRVRPGIPREVDRVVLRALEPERNRRWPSAAAFATALDEAAAALSYRPRFLVRRLAGSLLALAAVGVAGASGVAQATPAGWARVADDTGRLSVAVPATWAIELRDDGWENRPGLLVGADLSTWANPDSVSPGAFIGSGTPVTLPGHQECARQPARTVVVGGLTGRVERWTACAGTPVSYSEVLLPGTYVQIKQVGKADRTDELLGSLRTHS
jgi:eukaryotic-like serine/threonine-protein kinase